MGILFEYPAWFLLLCLIGAGLYSFLLYWRDRGLADVDRRSRWLMAGARFLAVLFLGILLLGPLLRSLNKRIEKPVIILALDNSASVPVNGDSAYYQSGFQQDVDAFIERLSGKYEVQPYLFGDQVRPGANMTYSDLYTDFSGLWHNLQARYSNRNVGALVLASDGLYNRGTNPAYSMRPPYPVYTVVLGDTAGATDLLLEEVEHNRMAFLGNEFPIRYRLKADALEGQTARLRISQNGTELYGEEIEISTDPYVQTGTIMLEARQAGFQRYTVSLSPLEGEISKRNNSREVLIEVISERKKVLFLAHAPHPDIHAMRAALRDRVNFETEYQQADRFTGDISDYNLLVLHQLPSRKHPMDKLVQTAIDNRIPILYILGRESALPMINRQENGLKIESRQRAFDLARPTVNKDFSPFTLPEGLEEMAGQFPPLNAPFGEYTSNAPAHVLFYQKIKNIQTSRPLVFFLNPPGQKNGFIAGDGLWAWRVYTYRENKNHELFDQLISRIVQYLSLDIKKQRFIVGHKQVYAENERVLFTAELYNESYEAVNGPDVELAVRDSEGKEYPFLFDKTEKAYRLDAGRFPPGDYSYTASVEMDGMRYTQTGGFVIVKVNAEAMTTRANHKLMYQLTGNDAEKFYTPRQLDKLAEKLLADESIVPVSYSEPDFMEMISLRWLFFFLLALLSLEWFLRKFTGGY